VGPDALTAEQRRRLADAGVVLLGARPSAEVPPYVQHADVLVVPHVVSAFTDSLDPIKLYEYLASGRPVVSTPVAGFRDADDPLVTVAAGEEFVAAVVAATTRDGGGVTPERDRVRRCAAERAREWDWARRVEEMMQVLQRVRVPRRPA
jgi:glycosyltransferase involved in cell wall biosynthesis